MRLDLFELAIYFFLGPAQSNSSVNSFVSMARNTNIYVIQQQPVVTEVIELRDYSQPLDPFNGTNTGFTSVMNQSVHLNKRKIRRTTWSCCFYWLCWYVPFVIDSSNDDNDGSCSFRLAAIVVSYAAVTTLVVMMTVRVVAATVILVEKMVAAMTVTVTTELVTAKQRDSFLCMNPMKLLITQCPVQLKNMSQASSRR